jgi:hypothetical protein
MKPIVVSEPSEAQVKLQPFSIRVDQASGISGLSQGSIRKAMSRRLFKSRVYCIGKGHNRVRLIDYQSFVKFLDGLPEDI